MDDHVEELERVRRTPWFRLGALFVAALTVLGTLMATWQNLALRAAAVMLLGALIVFVLEGAPRRSRGGSTRGRRRSIGFIARRAGTVLTLVFVGVTLVWTWRLYTAPDLSIESIRVAQLSSGGGSVLVTLDGGKRGDVVSSLTVLTAAEQISGCGGDGFESIAVSPIVAVSASEGGTLRITGQQESSLQPGATVGVQGGMTSDHCGDSSWLTLRPQQPVQASELGQIRIELPPDFEIESSEIVSAAGTQPVDVALETGVYTDSPGYEEYLRSILPGTTQGVLTWPWAVDKAAFDAAGWRAALMVAVSSNEEGCVVAAVDLLADEPNLLDADETKVIMDSGKTHSHLPAACL